MELPNYKPTNPNVQRTEVRVSDDKYLVTIVRQKDHEQEIDVTLYHSDLDLLAFITISDDGTVDVVVDKKLNDSLKAKDN
jgi:hypothetical protein